MGNIIKTMSFPERVECLKQVEAAETFKFQEPFEEVDNNGLFLNNVYIPEEIITIILSYVPVEEILRLSEVCKTWCNIVKSDALWFLIYSRIYKKKPKKLPWYVYYCLFYTKYFDRNLIKNGNGENGFLHWNIVYNYGDQFRIEENPCGADPLPLDIPEFNNKTSCFATSYYECNKYQEISFEKCPLMQFILNQFKPTIYVSEWMSGRFDCGCVYTLWCKLMGSKNLTNEDPQDEELEDAPVMVSNVAKTVEQWGQPKWLKMELIVDEYPKGVKRIVFQHEGKDTQFWKGHYGSKMAGGVVKVLFDSIKSL